MLTAAIAHSASNHKAVTLLKIEPSKKDHFVTKNEKTINSKINNFDFIKKDNYKKEELPSIKQITKKAVDTIMPTPKIQREQTELGKNNHPFSQIQPQTKGHPFSSTSPHTTGIK